MGNIRKRNRTSRKTYCMSSLGIFPYHQWAVLYQIHFFLCGEYRRMTFHRCITMVEAEHPYTFFSSFLYNFSQLFPQTCTRSVFSFFSLFFFSKCSVFNLSVILYTITCSLYLYSFYHFFITLYLFPLHINEKIY